MYCFIDQESIIKMMQQKCSISTLSNTGNRTNNWLQWKSNFIYYLEANNFTTKSEDLKIHLLKENIGEIGLKAIELLNKDSKTPINNMETLLRKLDTYFHVPKNEIVERYNFFTTSQSKDQSIDAYILVLKVTYTHKFLYISFTLLPMYIYFILLHCRKKQKLVILEL